MHEFKDNTGASWQIALPIGELKRIKAARPEFNLFEPGFDRLAERLDEDLMLFYDLLQILCEPQAQERGIDAEEFGRRLAADCLLDAQRVFFEEWRDFFHSLRRFELARAVEFISQQTTKARELVAAKLKAGEGTIRKLQEASVRQMEAEIGRRFSSLQELTESLDLKSSTASHGESSTRSTGAKHKRRAFLSSSKP